MKRIITFIIVLFLAVVLIGCSVEDALKKLDAPIIKTVQNNIVYWGSVDNAESYIVNVDDVFEQKTTDLNFDLGKVLSESKSGVVKVKAKGNGVTFTDSDWSNGFAYEFVKDNGGNNNNQNTQKQKLATPTITGYSNNTVTWNAIDNANGYIVKINGNEEKVYSTSYTVSFNESCNFTVQIKAVVNTGDTNYIYSNWSESLNYEFVIDSNSNVVSKEVLDEYIKYKLGAGVDVIYGTYLQDGDIKTIKPNYYLDLEKMSAAYPEIIPSNPGSFSFKYISGETIEDYMLDRQQKFSYGGCIEGGGNIKLIEFGGQMKNEFSFATNTKRTQNSYEYYTKAIMNYIDSVRTIKDFNIESPKYQDIVSDGAKMKLSELLASNPNDLDKKIEEFFKLFGTHIVVSSSIGGRVEINYHIISEEQKLDIDKIYKQMLRLDTEFKYAGQGGNTQQTVELGLDYHETNESKGIYVNFDVTAYGGSMIKSWNYENFNEKYSQWVDDYYTLNKNSLIDIGSMVAIWDLLPNEYNSLAERMKDVFEKLIKIESDKFYESFYKLLDNNPLGSKNNPIEISTEEEFYKYMDGNTNDKYYVLKNDIKLEKPNVIEEFNGNFDGGNNTIKGFVYTIDSTKFEENQHFGLFKINNGIISNLNLDGFEIKSGQQHSGAYVYTGLLCGKNNGEINNINIKSSYIELNRTGSSIGGIAGINSGVISACSVVDTVFFGNGDIGGIAGVNSNGSIIKDSKITGDSIESDFIFWYVNKSDNSGSRSVGGIVGYNQTNGKIINVELRNLMFILKGDAVKNYEPRVGFIIGESEGYLDGEKIMENLKGKQEGDFSKDMDFWDLLGDHYYEHKIYIFPADDNTIGLKDIGNNN